MSENSNSPGEHPDDIARLIRLAGKRRAVPPERLERVCAAAREQWRQEVHRRSRRRTGWTVAALAAAATLLVAAGLRFLPLGGEVPAPGRELGRVESLAGQAWAASGVGGAGPRSLAVQDALAAGSRVETSGDGRVAVRLESGHSVRLAQATTVGLREDGSLELERGALYVDSGPGGAARSLTVHTPLGRIEEIGTQFELRLGNESVRVRLREGAVLVRRRGAVHEVTAGQQLELDADGSVRRGRIPAYGPEWDWLSAVTPPLGLEGRSTRDFLSWAARERGWTLAFASDAALRAADETVLAGDVEGLSIEEALDVVLPISRMTYRIDEGVLHIARD